MSDSTQGTFKHTMADPQFGKLVPENYGQDRDAIHIATAAVIAAENLKPGDHVGFTTKSNDVMGKSEIAPLGIVDPFLKKPVKKGERFWVFMYPGTITSLRHNWSHPAFDVREKMVRAFEETPAKKRLKAFAAQLDQDSGQDDGYGGKYESVSYQDLIDRATAFVQSGHFWSEGGRFESQGLYDTFWSDFEEVTGIKVKDKDQYGFFSCSC